jgi:hypothetical protein
MPSKSPPGRRSKGKQRKPVKSTLKPSSALLVIECDAARLAADGLAMGQPLYDLIRLFILVREPN